MSALETCRKAFTALPALLEAEPHLIWRGRRFDCALMLEAGDARWHLRFRGGRIEEILEGDRLMRSWNAALRASPEDWVEFWRPVPKVGFHDLFAIAKRGRLRIEGDLHPVFSNLQYVKDVMALPRAAGFGPAQDAPLTAGAA